MTKLERFKNFFTNPKTSFQTSIGIPSFKDHTFNVTDSNGTTVTYTGYCVFYNAENDNIGVMLTKQVGDAEPTTTDYLTNVEPDGDVTFSSVNNTFESTDPETIKNFDIMLHRFFDAVAATVPV